MSDFLTPSRMEAFSDGVIAVIITIMVLELKVPAPAEMNNWHALRSDIPLVLVYLLSFVQTGIYWVNHHYLVDDVEHVTHGMLWSNLAFLFCLSLLPFATNWVGVRGVNSFSVAFYAIVSALPAVAWFVLSTVICRNTKVPLAAGAAKQIVSTAFYLAAIWVAQISPVTAIAILSVVAVLWLLPPRRVVEQIRATREDSQAHSEARYTRH